MKKIKRAFSNLRKRFSSINGGGGMGLRSMSEESLNKLDDCIQHMNEDVTKLYMECPETDLEDDPKFLQLLDGYFTTSEEITKLCESLRNSLENVQNYECELLEEALHDFEEEKRDYGEASSFRKTLKDLKSFNEFYNNVDEEDELVKTCMEDIVDMIVELEKMIKDTDKNLKRVRRIRAFMGVVLIVPALGLLLVKLIIPLAPIQALWLLLVKLIPLAPIQPLASCLVSIGKKSTEVLKMKKIVMVSMERGMKVALNEVEIIVKLVKRLRSVERLIRETTELAVEERSPVTEVMVGMKEEKEFMKSTIVDLDKETLRFDELSQFGRNVARKKIVEFLTLSERDRKN